MTEEGLVGAVARALAFARQPYARMDGAHNPLQAEYNEAVRLVGTVQQVTLEEHRASLCAFLNQGYTQAMSLYEGTGHPMWLGKALAYADMIEAIENGAL